MASTYTNTGVEIITSGEQEASWGATSNTNWKMIDKATAQQATVTLSGTASTLTLNDGVLGDDARAAYLLFDGTLAANHTVTIEPDDLQKIYYVENATVGGFGVIIKQGTGDTVAVAPGAIAIVGLDGAGVTAAVKRINSYSSGIDDKFYINAGEMYAYVAQGPGTIAYTDTKASPTYRAIRTWDFDAAGSEFVLFEKLMPADWDGGDLTFVPIWSSAAATSGTVRWRMQALALTAGVDLTADDWHSTYGLSTDTATAAGTVHYGPQSETFTAGGPAVAGDVVQFSLHRDATADTMANDARLQGVIIYYNQAEECVC